MSWITPHEVISGWIADFISDERDKNFLRYASLPTCTWPFLVPFQYIAYVFPHDSNVKSIENEGLSHEKDNKDWGSFYQVDHSNFLQSLVIWGLVINRDLHIPQECENAGLSF